MSTTMNISLPDNLATFIEQEVAGGGYASQSEVVRDALRLLHREKAVEQEKLEMLRRAVTVGIEDWRQGRVDDRPINEILDEIDEDEASLRLVRISALLGEMSGPKVVDLLIDVLGSDEPEARQAAGEALAGLSFERFKEFALGVERALERLPDGSPALSELPYLLGEIAEPGATKLLGRFLSLRDADAVAAAIEAVVQSGDASALSYLEPLATDSRRVQLEDDGGTSGEATLGELVAEAREILRRGATG